MIEVQINFWSVFVSTILFYALGAVWYSPTMFGKAWQILTGMTDAEMKRGMVKAYVGTFISLLVMAYVLAHFVQYANATTLLQGATAGFWAWLGFVGTTMAINTLYQNRPWKLYLIDCGYFLAGLILMGGIMGIWQ